MARIYVLDALGLAYRAHYAFIARPLINSKGEHTSAIFGFANTALKIRREEQPDYWALAWDGPGPTFRHERFPDYKATRKPMPDELLAQLEPIEDLAQAIGLPVLEVPGTEADDVMATLAHLGAEAGHEVVLVTGDKDMLQVVGPHVKVMVPQTRDQYAILDAAGVKEKWGVGPENIRDVLALMGDSSDNIPGVPGIGEKTAVELLRQFGSLDELYRRLDEVKRPALKAKLETHREQAMLSRELATVKSDLKLPFGLEDLRCGPVRRDALSAFAKRWEVRRLEQVAESLGVADTEAGALAPARSAERRGTGAETPAEGVKLAGVESVLPGSAAEAGSVRPEEKILRPHRPPSASASPAAAPPRLQLPRSAGPVFEMPGIAPLATASQAAARATQGTLDLFAGESAAADGVTLERLRGAVHAVRSRAIHGLAVLPVAEGARPRSARLVGLALAARDGTTCYVPLAHQQGPNFTAEEARELLAPALADPLCEKVGHDLKYDRHVLRGAGFALEGLAFDLHLGSFLCDATRDHSLEALARDVLGVAIEKLEPPERRGGERPGLEALAVEGAALSAGRAAACLFPLAAALTAQLEAREQWPLYEKLEHPLIEVLYRMERAGVALEPGVLAEMSAQAGAEITRLERELGELAGEPVNLNSGPQIAKLLFEKFKLKPGRRTKTGYSTDSEVLEALAAEHPFPKLLLEFRALAKLKSTYFDALPAERDATDGRVHTTFEQTGAATGRLSSSDPNLQNIPMRTPQGRAIRRAFVAAPGSMLVGADYSQIELRVMAHLSGDPNLIEAFRSGEDVHASTARRIFGVASGELDPALRARAKIVNFGVMYGMGARSLAQQMGIALSDAQDFISGYFRVYAGVRAYLDRTLEEGRTRGWVATLMGRRRYLPSLANADGLQRSNAERAAINTPIQGSAADLVKLAMLRVDAELSRAARGARLLLQVHDELLVECREGETEAVSALLKREMENCYPMSVPLTVSIGSGRSWFDVH